MDTLAGSFLFGVSLAAIVAITDGNGKLWWASLLGTLAGGPILVEGLSIAMHGTASSIAAAALAFLVPVIGLSVAISGQCNPRIAAGSGS